MKGPGLSCVRYLGSTKFIGSFIRIAPPYNAFVFESPSDKSTESTAFCSGYRFRLNSSGVYICKSIVNDLRHGNYICKPEGNYLTYEHRIEISVEFTYANQ